MKAETVRNKAKRFIEKGEMSQNDLARKSGIPTSTFSKFMNGTVELTNLDMKAILKVIEPHAFNPRVVGAKHRMRFLASGFEEDEIAIIAAEIVGRSNVSV